jgi:hypothetical protein
LDLHDIPIQGLRVAVGSAHVGGVVVLNRWLLPDDHEVIACFVEHTRLSGAHHVFVGASGQSAIGPERW